MESTGQPHSEGSGLGDGSLAGDEDGSDRGTGIPAAGGDANGCIHCMPVALLLSLWLVAWAMGSSLELLHQALRLLHKIGRLSFPLQKQIFPNLHLYLFLKEWMIKF